MSRGIRLTCTVREDNEGIAVTVIYLAGTKYEVEQLINYKGIGACQSEAKL